MAPHVLFVPVSGRAGLGESMRCFTLASALRERRPDARIRFLLDRAAPLARDLPFELHAIDGSPTDNTAAVRAVFEQDPPRVAIFDSTCRAAQLRAARRVGARTIFIASRPGRRRRALRARTLSRLDQIWLVEPAFSRRALSAWERLKLRLRFERTQVLLLDSIFPESSPVRRAASERELGLIDRPYALLVPGGGGYAVDGRPTPLLFAEAAARVAREARIACVLAIGPSFRGEIPSAPGVVVARALGPGPLIDLLQGAAVVALGGGSVLGQALSLKKACVAAALGGSDQRRRIERCARLGLVEPAPTEASALAEALLRLLREPGLGAALRQRLESLGLRNGLPLALDSLDALAR